MSLDDEISVLNPSPPPDPSLCWFCGGEKRVEWSGAYLDDDGNLIHEEGVYDPCPECRDDPRNVNEVRDMEVPLEEGSSTLERQLRRGSSRR